MQKFFNPHPYSVELVGPKGERIIVKSKNNIILSDYYLKYVRSNFISIINHDPGVDIQKIQDIPKIGTHDPGVDIQNKARRNNTSQNRNKVRLIEPRFTKNAGQQKPTKIVGKTINVDPKNLLNRQKCIRISNGVGVGILSYNRGKSLKRCVDSIVNNTDLDRVSLFISDDCSTDEETIHILDEISKDIRITVIRNKENVGISSNSNRLLRCLSRFQHIFLCNDDIEILGDGWDDFYIKNSAKSGLEHLCFRQTGIYGANKLKPTKINDVDITVVEDKPHGAFLYITSNCFEKIGYFDSNYEFYGMEHVDWSMKPHEFGVQPSGFYDFFGSEKYIKINDEPTSINDKITSLRKNREKFKNRIACQRLDKCHKSLLPSISYIIPCRMVDRIDSIKTVVQCMIGQSFPVINIFLVEQDNKENLNNISNVNYILSKNVDSELFNKSQAFNVGVNACVDDIVILHDADMMSSCDYTTHIYDMLNKFDSIHVSSNVLYLDKNSTEIVNKNQRFLDDLKYERIVNYFEGGSLACKRSTYWSIGGFNQDFKGYGVEDCDFYYRLSNGSNFSRTNDFNLIHLWHDRQAGWSSHHDSNKALGSKLDSMSLNDRINAQKQQMRSLRYK